MTWNQLNQDLSGPPGRFLGSIPNLDLPSGLIHRFSRRKAWVFGAVHGKKFSVGVALVDGGALSKAFFYIWDHEEMRLIEEEISKPFGFSPSFPAQLKDHWHVETEKGSFCFCFKTPQSGTPSHEIETEETALASTANATYNFVVQTPKVELKVSLHSDPYLISALNKPLGNRIQYTEKNVGMFASVEIVGEGIDTTFTSALGSIDYSFGYPPQVAQWQWASLAGSLKDDRFIGVNAVAHYFNGLENAIWVGKEGNPSLTESTEPTPRVVRPLPQVVFHRTGGDHPLNSEWEIFSLDETFRVRFLPGGKRETKLNLGINHVTSTQFYGMFLGTYKDPDGNELPMQGYGVVEEHDAKW